MVNQSDETLYFANSMVVCECDGGVILKRGSVEVRVTGQAVLEIIHTLLDSVQNKGATRKELIDSFPQTIQKEVAELLDEMIQRRLFETEGSNQVSDSEIETPVEIFFWEFGLTSEKLKEISPKRHIAIVGINNVSLRLVESLMSCGFENISVVDHPFLKNIQFDGDASGVNPLRWNSSLPVPIPYDEWDMESEELDMVVATSDLGGMHLLREINDRCVSADCAFMPAVLQNMIGSVGPLVVPGATACYECLRARQNSNMDNPDQKRMAEKYAYEMQLGVSFHPSMAAIVGDITATEISKFLLGRIAGWQVGKLIEIDLVKPAIDTRTVLKIPRCKVCGNVNQLSTASIEGEAFVPHQVRGGSA